ncbi:site-specific DNA-methyltransferase [Candidatus Poribacteria bacterium]|nr:site-specific DNA-methyltransferase [Candidatus Poribacteria bacterium]
MKRAKSNSLRVDSVQCLLFEDEQEEKTLQPSDIVILPPQDVMQTLQGVGQLVTTTILDPWYNKGVGGVRPDYYEWLFSVVCAAAKISNNIFLWGFPEIVYKVLDHLPTDFILVAWLTWYYKNCPSVIRGWRSAQLACLHIAKPSAKLYPEHFLNEAQLEKQRQGKLRYMPGPPSVIEAPLLVGFVGKYEQVGHPAQKPIKVIEPIVLMTTKEGDIVLDPMCGSGTTGEVCKKLGRRAILCDESEEYICMTENRLKLHRVDQNVSRSRSYF